MRLALCLPISWLVTLLGCQAPDARSSGPDAQPTPASAHTDEPGAPFLWRVAGPNPSYLLGTLPYGVSASRDVPGSVWARLDSARAVVVKTDTWNLDPVVMSRRARVPGTRTLRDQLSDAHWQRLRTLLAETLPEPKLAYLQPWFVQRNVIAALVPTPRPMDVDIMIRAQLARKPLVPLERWQDQVDVIARVFTLEDLVATLDSIPEKRRRLEATVRAYREGDLAAATRLIFDAEELRRNPRIAGLLLEERNRAWIQKLAPQLVEGGVFVALGLDHLLGRQGILNLLREQGFELTRVSRP